MQPGEPVLLICRAFPPIFGIGGRRWAKFAKELARRGHPVHVIRCAHAQGAPVSLWNEDGATPGIIHHPLPARYPAVIAQPVIRSLKDKLLYRAWMKMLPLLCKGNWFDSTILWRKQLLRKAGQLIGEHGIRQVVVTGAPFRLMAYGAELKQLFPQINLVVDFRDEWTWKGHYGQASIGAKRLAFEKELEALAIGAADRVIAPAASVVGHLRSAYPAAQGKCSVVEHPVDPDDIQPHTERRPGAEFRMIYAGNTYGGKESELYFAKLLSAVKAVTVPRPGNHTTCHLDLYFIGQDARRLETMVKANGLQARVRFHAPAPPKVVMNEIANSDLALSFIPNEKKDAWATKFNELAYAGTPILHVGEPGLVSRTIEARRMGASIRVEELVAELPKIIGGERVIEVDKHADHSAYLLANVTDRLLAEVLTD